jgi:hypothetical protein
LAVPSQGPSSDRPSGGLMVSKRPPPPYCHASADGHGLTSTLKDIFLIHLLECLDKEKCDDREQPVLNAVIRASNSSSTACHPAICGSRAKRGSTSRSMSPRGTLV